MYVLIFSTTFVWEIPHSKKNWEWYDKNVDWSSRKVPVIRHRVERSSNFLDRFLEKKKLKYQISW
jgi:hypothetical protein